MAYPQKEWSLEEYCFTSTCVDTCMLRGEEFYFFCYHTMFGHLFRGFVWSTSKLCDGLDFVKTRVTITMLLPSYRKVPWKHPHHVEWAISWAVPGARTRQTIPSSACWQEGTVYTTDVHTLHPSVFVLITYLYLSLCSFCRLNCKAFTRKCKEYRMMLSIH